MPPGSDTHTCVRQEEKHGQRTHPATEQRRVHPARTDDRHRHSGDSRSHRRPEIHGRAPQGPRGAGQDADRKPVHGGQKFYLDNGFYPSTEQGLEALVTRPAIGKTPKNYPANGYITKIPKDPWDNDYVYTAPGQKVPFEIMSLGSDGAEGGEGEAADIWGEDVPDR